MQRIELSEMLESASFRVMSVVTAEEALQVLSTVPGVQAVVADVKLSSDGMDGFELAQTVRRNWNIGAIAVSGQVAPAEEELPVGVHFVAKPVHEATLIHLVRSILADRAERPSGPADTAPAPRTAIGDARGPQLLTPRQQNVLELLVRGKSNREIAEALGLSEHTVKVHLAAIFRVLGVSSRLEAVLAGMQRLHTK